MRLKIYKISFNTNIIYLNEYYGLLTDIQKTRIGNFNIISSFYYNQDINLTGYIIMDANEMESYKKILNDNLIPYLCEDISQYVLNNQINLEIELEENVDFYNSINYDTFIFETNKWIVKNLTLDNILDRINTYGIETLRPIDKEFLNNI